MQKAASAQQITPAGGEESEISLTDLLMQLLARKWWLLSATLLGAIIGTFLGQLPPNEFQAHSVVQIEQRTGPQLPSELIGELLGAHDRRSSLATEIHIIQSRLILAPVVEGLSLDVTTTAVKAPIIGDLLARRNLPLVDGFLSDAYARPGETIRVVPIEMPEEMPSQPVRMTVRADRAVALTFADGTEIAAPVNEPIQLPGGGAIEIIELSAPPGREYVLSFRPLRDVVRALSSRLDIRERGSSGIVDFRYAGNDARESVQVINRVVAAYQDHNLRRRAAEIDQSIDFIEEQLPEIRGDLQAASSALAEYRQSDEGRELSITTQDLLEQTVNLETQIEDVSFRREQLLQRLTPNHPDYLALQREEDRLQARLTGLRDQLSSVPEAEQELARLTQRVERARQLELQLVNRVEQLRILRASTVGNIFVLEPAEIGRHVGPDRRMPIAIGAAIGFVLSALGIFGLNILRRGIEDGREIEELGLSLFATINKAPELVGIKPSDTRYGIANADPKSVVAEAFRGLRTGLRFSMAATKSKSLMITSCAPSDGKSFISLNLAMVSGQANSRVLLIDADMRRGFLRQYFGLKRNAKGLSDILSGSATIDEVIYGDTNSGIDFMPTGAYPPNPAELLASPSFGELLGHLDQHYDLVIVDAPPVLAVADPGIIGQYVGMSLLVVRHLSTTKMDLQFVQKTLENSGVSISGCVLNQFDQKASRYGAYGTKYGYTYGGYSYKYD